MVAASVDLGIVGLSSATRIGSGGFADVYRATDGFGRTVAVKVLRALDEAGRRRFDRERAAMGLVAGHPDIVVPFTYGYLADGVTPYLVMEHLAGGSLQAEIERSGPMTTPDAVLLLLPIVEALGASHAAGIVHRDVKPANILLTGTGTAKLADFGIASLRDATESANIAYTLGYSPPESFRATGAGGTDPRDERSDLYSLAATLHAAVTGHAPFEGGGDRSIASLIGRILTQPVAPTGRADLDAFLGRALAKDPEVRFSDAAAFAAALRPLADPGGEVDEPARIPSGPAGSSGVTAPALPAGPATVVALPGSATVAVSPPQGPRPDQAGAADPTAGPAGGDTIRAVGHGGDHGTAIPGDESRQRRAALAGVLTGALTLLAVGVLAREAVGDGDEPAVSTDQQLVEAGEDDVGDAVRIPQGDAPRSAGATSGADEDAGPSEPSGPNATDAAPSGFPSVTGVLETPVVYRGAAVDNGPWRTAVLPDGTLATSVFDDTVQIWDPAAPDVPPVVYRGHSDDVRAVVPLADGTVATSSDDLTVQIWDPERPELTLATFTGHTDLAWDLVELPDGRIASVSYDLTVRVWDLGDPSTVTIIGIPGGTVRAAAVLPDGRVVLTGAGVSILDPDDPIGPAVVYEGHSTWVESVTVLSDGLVASGDDNGDVHIWDPERPDDAPVTVFHGSTDDRAATSLAELPDGRLVTAFYDGPIRIWDRARPEEALATYTGHRDVPWQVVALADGNVVSTSHDGTVQIWDPDAL